MGEYHNHRSHVGTSLNQAFAVGIVLNITFVAVEAFYGWRVDSLALMADAGHNLSDVAGLILAWIALLIGRVKPNHRHTYGLQRASVLAAFINSIVLLIAMGVLTWEALHRLHSATSTDGLTIIVVAGIGLFINGLTAFLFFRDQSHDLNVRGAFLHMAADAAISAGVVVSGIVYLYFQWEWLDPVVSLGIAIIIVWSSWKLLSESVHLLFDGVPENISFNEVREWLITRPGVTDIHDLHIWALSTTEVALTAHLIMPNGHPGDDFIHRAAHDLHEMFGIIHPTLQIETASKKHTCPQETCRN
ncbi:MAG: cation diffusion facilitator family transporter [Pseudomonadota bacterium]